MSKILEIYVDGSATYDLPGLPRRGSNARISCAYEIYDGEEVVDCGFYAIPYKGTINQAEFIAVIYGLKAAKTLDAKDVVVYSDSQLVVNAINRTDGKTSAVVGSKEWTAKIKGCMDSSFDSAKIVWIPREKNKVDEYLTEILGITRSKAGKEKKRKAKG